MEEGDYIGYLVEEKVVILFWLYLPDLRDSTLKIFVDTEVTPAPTPWSPDEIVVRT